MLWQRADELYTFQQYLEAIMPPPRMRAPDVFPVSTVCPFQMQLVVTQCVVLWRRPSGQEGGLKFTPF